MKKLMMMIVLCTSSFSLAETKVCNIENTDKTLLLKKIKDLPFNPNDNIDTKATYKLEIQTTELPAPSESANGTAITSDIHFNFKSKNSRYKVNMYLDDAAGTLTVGKKEYSISDCIEF